MFFVRKVGVFSALESYFLSEKLAFTCKLISEMGHLLFLINFSFIFVQISI